MRDRERVDCGVCENINILAQPACYARARESEVHLSGTAVQLYGSSWAQGQKHVSLSMTLERRCATYRYAHLFMTGNGVRSRQSHYH